MDISIQKILEQRIDGLYKNLKIKLDKGPEHTYYYTLLNLEKMAKDQYGIKFANYLTKNFTAIDFLFRLAKEKFTICLPGAGFAGPKWSIRLALANLSDKAYPIIGKNIKAIMDQYYKEWKK